MDQLARTNWLARQLRAPICDYLICVRVRARARASLENVEREMVVQFAFNDFFGRLHDQGRAFGVEQTEIVIGLGGGPLNDPESANEWARETVTADRKVKDRALGGGAIERRLGERHFSHRIFFHPRPPAGHALFAEARFSWSDKWDSPLRPFPFSKTVMNIGGMFCRTYSDSARSKILACCFSSFVT